MDRIPVWAPVVTSIISLVGIVLVLISLRNSIRQTKFNMLMHIQAMVLQPDVQRAMRELHALEAEAVCDPQSPAELERVELVLRTYDILGHRLRCGVLPLEETLETEAIPILSLWPKLRGFVECRARFRSVPYKPHLQWLVERADDYRVRHFPNAKLGTWVWQFASSDATPQRQAAPGTSIDGGA